MLVPEMKKQPLASFAQVASVPVPWQKVPAAVQPAGGALQVQAAGVPPQVLLAEHAASAPQAGQPPAASAQVCSPPPLPQRLAPTTHTSGQAPSAGRSVVPSR